MVDIGAQAKRLPKWSWYAGGAGLLLGGFILVHNRGKQPVPVSDTAVVDPAQTDGTGVPSYPAGTGGSGSGGGDQYDSGMPGPSGAPGEQGPQGDPGPSGADAVAPTAGEVAAELAGSLGTERTTSKAKSAAAVKDSKAKALSAADKRELTKENQVRAQAGMGPRKIPSYTHSGTGPPNAGNHHSPVHVPVHPTPPHHSPTTKTHLPTHIAPAHHAPTASKAPATSKSHVTVTKPTSVPHAQPKSGAVHTVKVTPPPARPPVRPPAKPAKKRK